MADAVDETPLTSEKGSTRSNAGFYPATTKTSHARTEPPKEPHHIYHAFESTKVDDAPIGNPDLVLSLKLEGQLGIFYDRSATARLPTAITISAAAIRSAAYCTLRDIIVQKLQLSDHVDPNNVLTTAQTLALRLVRGISVLLYCKLKQVNYWNLAQAKSYLRKPKVPEPFLVPLPYALAISQLGQIQISGLPTEVFITPTVTEAEGQQFCLNTRTDWSPTDYAQAVDYAKKIGLQFTTADLDVKMGSSWWIYNPRFDDNILTLECPVPEENFTPATAILHSLFAITDAGSNYNPIADLSPLGADVFGTMMRNPPDRIDLLVFNGVAQEEEATWKIA